LFFVFFFIDFEIKVDYAIDVDMFIGQFVVKIGDGFIAHFFYKAHHYTVFHLYFAVFESSLQKLFPIFRRFILLFVQGLLYLYPPFRCRGYVEPVLFRGLVGRGKYFDRIAAFQFIFYGFDLSVYLAADTFAA